MKERKFLAIATTNCKCRTKYNLFKLLNKNRITFFLKKLHISWTDIKDIIINPAFRKLNKMTLCVV